MVRSTLVGVARNEARDIEEWVRFHRGIGFDRVEDPILPQRFGPIAVRAAD